MRLGRASRAAEAQTLSAADVGNARNSGEHLGIDPVRLVRQRKFHPNLGSTRLDGDLHVRRDLHSVCNEDFPRIFDELFPKIVVRPRFGNYMCISSSPTWHDFLPLFI